MTHNCYDGLGNIMNYDEQVNLTGFTINFTNTKKATVKVFDGVLYFNISTNNNIWILFINANCEIITNHIFKNGKSSVHYDNTYLKFNQANIPVTLNREMSGDLVFGANSKARLKYQEDLGILTLDKNLYPVPGTNVDLGSFDYKFNSIHAVTYASFTGCHICKIEPKFTNIFSRCIGYIVVSNGNVPSVSISSALPFVELSNKDKDKKVFGVISDVDSDKNTAKVNSLGEGAIYVTNKNGNIENGDYLTSSSITGIGMKQVDDVLRNYTVAKATIDCDFDSEFILITENGQILEKEDDKVTTYKAKLIPCTYHCG